ncbi:KTSC domain-containing protein [Methanobrevibacter sp. TMH8]|uniref:KTSC domain-containing protein n=1 Tax=Methanobrevibacter sp. TMH8 TaxID=2848611 RepID=UPI001CCE7E51|nr:KTSC domain-containing protein [Methanobrevibacter sp. TMH8]MBZ9571054.1 KTSC domain-containing protein [Methanobrevibacter sp. TMH8]
MNLFLNNIAFERVYYDNKNKLLFVIFRNTHFTKYVHENVPVYVFDDFKNSNFSNRFYHKNIKDKYKKDISFLTPEDRDFLNISKY